MSKLKSILSRLKKVYAMRSSDSWLNYLRNTGMKIGKGTVFFSRPSNILIDLTRPWLIEIGDNVQITKGVTILTHGYDWSVLKSVYGDIYGSSGKVKIGNNCFIGMNTTILKGSVVGDNVIIGAGSVLSGKTYPSNSVVAGNPARVICSLEEYREKRKAAQIDEAKELVQEYYKRYGTVPSKSTLSEFFWLFEERKEIKNGAFNSQMRNMGNYTESYNRFLATEPQFENYKSFLDFCLNDIKG